MSYRWNVWRGWRPDVQYLKLEPRSDEERGIGKMSREAARLMPRSYRGAAADREDD